MKIIKYGDKIKPRTFICKTCESTIEYVNFEPKKKFHASTEYFLLCPICNTANIVQKAVE